MIESTATGHGGSWLTTETPPGQVMTPERVGEDHRLIAQTTREFVANEVLPAVERLEAKDWALARTLLSRCGELGLLGVQVPEAYGGVALDKLAAVIVSEALSAAASFGAAYGAQANLAIAPILWFGSDAQKASYLPGLVRGELVGAYALSESGSGSDALGARAVAHRQSDGSFVLSGEKMWITNGGFADLFVVFAKVDGAHFSAFIVDRRLEGVRSGKEEHKMGLHGSSTTPLLLQEVHLPATSLLGEVGRGHKVAFNVLNYGRFKLAAMTSGGAKAAIGEAARYAADRHQFGRPIASFGAIKHKLGEMSARAYAVESMLYRVAGHLDALAPAAAPDADVRAVKALEELAVEASILKVTSSEMLDYVLDENVQIHGGNGFVRDYPAERRYRDARVNRIFEGTNEINRLLIPTLLVKRLRAGRLPSMFAGGRQPVPSERAALAPVTVATLVGVVANLKALGLLVLARSVEAYGETLSEAQETLSCVADLISDAFAAESALLRARQALDAERSTASLMLDATAVVVNDGCARAAFLAGQALSALPGATDPSALRGLLDQVQAFLPALPCDTIGRRRRLADAAVALGAYPFAA